MATKLAALVVLVAFLAGPAACEGINICLNFNGWLKPSILDPLFCPRGSGPPVPSPSGSGLSYGYYTTSCPTAEKIIKDAVKKAVEENPGIGAGLIRLFFHDCFVRGCDASVLLNTTNSKNSDTEREGPPNQNSLRGFEVIDEAKTAIEAACKNTVSCADIVAFAARDASYFLSNGSINIPMPGGRYDGRESFADETDQLPGPFSNVAQLQASFAAKGLTSDEMATLSGAHTIGRARCMFFSSRLSEMNQTYADNLRAECGDNGNTNVNQDNVTSNVLDKQYYQNVIDNKVLFTSDAVLNSTEETRTQVMQNANTAGAWERKFEKAMEKMGKIKGNQQSVEIRKVCWKVNNGQ
ncbi:hypothetical protein ACQJBY_023554 [Aegilops geniculata]